MQRHGDEQLDTITSTLLRSILEREIRPRITPELIAEHRENPTGRHSLELDLVLNFLRRAGGRLAPRYLILCDPEPERYRVGRVTTTGPTTEVSRHGDRRFDSVDEVEHWIFVRRLTDLGLIDADV